MSPASWTSGANRTRLLLAVAVAIVAVAVLAVSETQRRTADRLFEESHAAHEMVAGMLDQETGLRGYAITGMEAYLEPFRVGGRNFDAALADARRLADADAETAAIERIAQISRAWERSARQALVRMRSTPDRLALPVGAEERQRLFGAFRTEAARLDRLLNEERADELRRAGLVSVAVIVVLALLFGGFGSWAIERQSRRARLRRATEREYRRTQAEFGETMQIMRTEEEAHALVRRHLERTIADSDVLVLIRNNSANRLVASTPIDHDADLAERLVDAEPDACLAVRLGREYEQGAATEPLLRCELCGASASEVACMPSLVGGEVIGSVLVRHERPLEDTERERIASSVSQAAPVLANLRNLAIAESRAETDALTGLPNARSCRDNLKRMVAHAGRAVSPLSAVMIDLDHFKQVNDRYGHGAGDDVLAATGEVLRAALRDSDFGGRYGGEEFLVLLPVTEHAGALALAEKLRAGIAALELSQPDLKVTASFGIATYPLDALDADALVRMADRALYAAKSAGRNRVELIGAGADEPSPQPAADGPA